VRAVTVSAKPQSITLFNRLNLAATVVGVLNILFHYGSLRELALSKGASPAGPFVGMVIVVLSYLIFWYFIYRRENKIAKWAFLTVTAFSIIMLPFGFREVLALGADYAVPDLSVFALQLAASAMLIRDLR
jgi:hypothetical protein